MEPTYTSFGKFYQRVSQIWIPGNTYSSLIEKKTYEMQSASPSTLTFKYEGGSAQDINLKKLYAMYKEIYEKKSVDRYHFHSPAASVHIPHIPGAAMVALLPVIDSKIRFANGMLQVR